MHSIVRSRVSFRFLKKFFSPIMGIDSCSKFLNTTMCLLSTHRVLRVHRILPRPRPADLQLHASYVLYQILNVHQPCVLRITLPEQQRENLLLVLRLGGARGTGLTSSFPRGEGVGGVRGEAEGRARFQGGHRMGQRGKKIFRL